MLFPRPCIKSKLNSDEIMLCSTMVKSRVKSRCHQRGDGSTLSDRFLDHVLFTILQGEGLGDEATGIFVRLSDQTVKI